MEVCDVRHESKYQIIYHSAKGSNYNPVWLVCDSCMENKRCFSDKTQIKSIEVLVWKLVKFALNLLNLEKIIVVQLIVIWRTCNPK